MQPTGRICSIRRPPTGVREASQQADCCRAGIDSLRSAERVGEQCLYRANEFRPAMNLRFGHPKSQAEREVRGEQAVPTGQGFRTLDVPDRWAVCANGVEHVISIRQRPGDVRPAMGDPRHVVGLQSSQLVLQEHRAVAPIVGS